MATTTARRRTAKPRSIRRSTPKQTAYGRAVLRAVDRMRAAGPWEFAARSSDRYFKR